MRTAAVVEQRRRRSRGRNARSAHGMGARTLGQAFDEFRRWASPWLISSVLVLALGGRLLLGGFTLTDLWVVLGFVAAQPFVEWVVHVVMLHWRPRQIGPVTLDLHAAKKHRAHHADPRDPSLVFIPLRVLVVTLVVEIALWWAVMPRIELALTAIVTVAVVGLVYEWTHFLVHTDHVPTGRVLGALRRNHRLHHFRNEHYWFTITNPVADHVLGTAPAKEDVEVSPTARDLLGAGETV